MIDVKEHVYDDDPARGPRDVKTRLKDGSYFFLGNGKILGAIQIAPGGEGTPVGLLLMNPECLEKKRDALSFHPHAGLDMTLLRIQEKATVYTAAGPYLQAKWSFHRQIPSVEVRWETGGFQVVEEFFCPNRSQPLLLRNVRIRNQRSVSAAIVLQTGILDLCVKKHLDLASGAEGQVVLKYTREGERNKISCDLTGKKEAYADMRDFWKKAAAVTFSSDLLSRIFNAVRFQLPAVISSGAKVDASIWQYNREWVRDHAMMALGLVVSGQHTLARKVLERLLQDFVSDEGDCIDSSEKRDYSEVELDQNGELLYALQQYVAWTGDKSIVSGYWKKIIATAEFPLKKVFRHEPSGLIANSREYWERHRAHGVLPGIELAYQMFVSLGLSSAASLARLISHESEAVRWENEALRIKQTLLSNQKYGLVVNNRFIKRRSLDGSIQDIIQALPGAGLPQGSPLAVPGDHRLNPDTTTALPIAFGFIPPDSSLAANTMQNLEALWNQSWQDGGYGRYNATSEPDAYGSWPFPSLFLARAYTEMQDYDRVWKILKWLDTIPGALSGSWFEFNGDAHSPPFPQIGITPWTWAEILLLLVSHVIGIQPEFGRVRIRPRLLPGLEYIHAVFPLGSSKLHLNIQRTADVSSPQFFSNGKIILSSQGEILIEHSQSDLSVEIKIPG